MIKLTHPEQFGLPERPEGSQGPSITEILTKRFSGATQELVGPQIEGEQGFSDVQGRFGSHLDVPETQYVPTAAPVQEAAPQQKVASQEVTFNPGAVARNTAKAFAGGGAVAGALATGGALSVTGLTAEGAALAAVTAAPIALNAAMVMGSTFLGGALHNLVWQRPGGKKPGFWGTMGRGLISPVSVPVGVAYRVMRG